MSATLDQITLVPLTGTEAIHASGRALGPVVLDFWRWGVSDLVSNATRGRLAEFIVAVCLGASTIGVREEWAAYDLVTSDGIRVEVKSSSFLQSWKQTRPSRISFSIRQTHAWASETNTFDPVASRQADVYVFAHLAHKSKETLDPLDLDQWRFYPVSARVLDVLFPVQRSISLKPLEAFCLAVLHGHLRSAVRRAREVASLASTYSDGRNGMGMQYTGGPVTAQHLRLWFTPSRPDTFAVFGTTEPSDDQFELMARDITTAMRHPDA